jgi:hypothetical protein
MGSDAEPCAELMAARADFARQAWRHHNHRTRRCTALTREAALGVTAGHAEVTNAIAALLREMEGE